jgi:hypothetical protein
LRSGIYRPGPVCFLPLLICLAAFSCGHIEEKPEAPPIEEEKEDWRVRMGDRNSQYVKESLGSAGEDPWFSALPGDPNDAFFYYIALSNKTASEQRARTNAQNDARRLMREYYQAATGREPGPRIGRGIEVVNWKIINGETEQGTPYYIACALVRIPADFISEPGESP